MALCVMFFEDETVAEMDVTERTTEALLLALVRAPASGLATSHPEQANNCILCS
ncbi:hypothetical protein [Paenibacillus oryzisoli]|uniref:hypothetical protein n=1 Tax=Paenibacillus oryzisoli TaxID=1850517 RepID=UPI0012FA21DC|nr:hypothetical protein [Paenibacillus oryzisoli]